MKSFRIILACAFALCLLVVVRAAQLTVNIGTTANDGTGDTLRTAFGKVNTNFTELYGYIGSAGLVAHCGTVAELQAYNPTNARIAVVHGYWTRGDGGGGVFYPTNTITSTNIGTRIVSTNYVTWSWDRIYDGPLNVKWFGAKGDGSTDDTTAIQSALTTVSNANGGSVFVPLGRYIVNNVAGCSNLVFYGAGAGSVLKQKASAVRALSFNYTSGGTTNSDDNMRNVTLRNLTFEGRSVDEGFVEQYHLLGISAVSDFVIQNCVFKGPQGDAIYIGSGQTGGIERHNKNITIADCVFDGLNTSNRNAISVIDADGISIHRNTFTRFSKSGMPGAIDFEPNASYNILKNIRIRDNSISGITNGAAVMFYVTSSTNFYNVLVEGNSITNCYYGLRVATGLTHSTTNNPSGFAFRNNHIEGTTGYPINLAGMAGVDISGNTILESYYGAVIDTTRDITFNHNTLRRVGLNSGAPYGLGIVTVYGANITGNRFIDCGATNSSTGRGINLTTGGASSNLVMVANTFTSPLGLTATGAIVLSGTHSQNKESNIEIGTVLIGFNSVSGNTFEARNYGTLSPEGAVTADAGALYLRKDGSTNTTLYVKVYGTGNTGWVAK